MKRDNDDMAARLRVLRESYGFTGHGGSGEWANFLGIGQARLSNVEHGKPLGIEFALIIVQRCPGISLDWLYLGKVDGLSLAAARRLGVLPGGTPASTAPDLAAIMQRIADNADRLDERQRYVIKHRLGLDDAETKPLRELATDLGVTRERVRQIEKQALRKLGVDDAIKVPQKKLREVAKLINDHLRTRPE